MRPAPCTTRSPTTSGSSCSMSRGATWDVDLEERVGRAIGAELRARGGNFFGGVCLNLPRHPAWGRVKEPSGAAAVMSAYNSVDGEWAGQNPMLLTTVLRDDWGFTGTVITDFIWGMRDGTVALRAGLDVEAPFREQRATHLAADLAAGRARWDDVERAALRTLGTQLRHYVERDEQAPDAAVVAGPEHRGVGRLLVPLHVVAQLGTQG